MRRVLATFLAAKAISDVGYALDFICLTVFVWVRTGSPLATGLLGLLLYAGGVTGGRLGHRFGGRWDRRRAMIASDLGRAGVLVLLAVLPVGAQLWWLYPAVFVVGLGRSVFEATLSASVPALVGSRTQRMNSGLAGLKGLSQVLGMGIAAIAVPVIGFRGVFLADAGSYLLSAVALLMLPLRLREGETTRRRNAAVPQVWPAMLAAGLLLLVAVRGLDALGSSSHHVGLPILGSELRPDNPAAVVGLVWMTWAAGMLLGSFAIRPLLAGAIELAPSSIFFAATAVMSAGFIGIFWLPGWPARVAAAVVAGIGDALSEITFRQAVQRLPDQLRGGAFGLSQMVVNAGFIAGLVVTGAALAPDIVAGWVLALHSIPLVAALSALAFARKGRHDGVLELRRRRPAERTGASGGPHGA